MKVSLHVPSVSLNHTFKEWIATTSQLASLQAPHHKKQNTEEKQHLTVQDKDAVYIRKWDLWF